jgi:hypothetical protein
MASPDIVTICISALITVFALLGFLAAVMKLVVLLFPEKAATDDPTVAAALAASVAAHFPGRSISRIEEIK